MLQTEIINPKMTAIQFINESETANHLTGELFINRADDHYSFTQYHLYWGQSAKQKLSGYSAIADFTDLKRPLIHVFNEQCIPTLASHFIVEAVNQQGIYLYASVPIVTQHDLLPINANTLERSLAKIAGRLDRLPVGFRRLWDINDCPASFLPWLGWSFSTDIWPTFPEQLQRQDELRRAIICQNLQVHEQKGTRASIQAALNALQVGVEIVEWFDDEGSGEAYHFTLKVLINEQASSAELEDKIRRAIDAAKPVRSHYTLIIQMTQSASLRLATIAQGIHYKHFTMMTTVSEDDADT